MQWINSRHWSIWTEIVLLATVIYPPGYPPPVVLCCVYMSQCLACCCCLMSALSSVYTNTKVVTPVHILIKMTPQRETYQINLVSLQFHTHTKNTISLEERSYSRLCDIKSVTTTTACDITWCPGGLQSDTSRPDEQLTEGRMRDERELRRSQFCDWRINCCEQACLGRVGICSAPTRLYHTRWKMTNKIERLLERDGDMTCIK